MGRLHQHTSRHNRRTYHLLQDFAYLQAQLPALPINELVADAALGYVPCLGTVYDAPAIPIVDTATTAPTRGRVGSAATIAGCARSARTASPSPSMASTTRAYAPVGHAARSAPAPPTPRRAIVRTGTRRIRWGWSNTSPAPSPPVSAQCPSWKTRYHSRRYAQPKHLGLVRIPSHGLDCARDDIAIADLLINLRNLARLVQQAMALTA